MRKRILLYIVIVITLFIISSIFIIPELNNYKKIIKFILLGLFLYSTIYNIIKSKLFIKILLIVLFFISLAITSILEPTNGFILESEKYYITKLNDIYLYTNYVMIDGYLLVYEKDKYLPLLHFKTFKEYPMSENDKNELKEIDNKVYIQINDENAYLIEMNKSYWEIE